VGRIIKNDDGRVMECAKEEREKNGRVDDKGGIDMAELNGIKVGTEAKVEFNRKEEVGVGITKTTRMKNIEV